VIEYLGVDVQREGNFVLVRVPRCPMPGCPDPNKDRTLSIPGEVWHRYGVQGLHVQQAWPGSSASDRERLMTGSHGECWDRVFADMEAE